MAVVATFCVLVCENRFREQAWSLARALLTSQMGQRTRKALISILNGTGTGQRPQGERRANDELNEKKMKRMLRGAIFCLANANWGTAQIDAVRCSPASIIEPMRNAVQVDETVCYDVLFDIRRLIQRHGRDLQHMTWIKLVELFETVIDLCEQRSEYASTCENSLHQILLLTEQLYSDGQFGAPPDLLYDLIEKCADRRPDTSVVKLIQYRSMNLTPLTPNWIQGMLQLVRRYSNESQRPERRSKVLSELHAFYTKYRLLYEHELVTQLMIPVLQDTENESSSRIQYLMLNILFDVAKTVSLRDDARLFESVMGIVKQLFASSIVKTTAETALEDEDDAETVVAPTRPPPRVPASKAGSLSFDNLEVVAQSMGELLSERWPVLNLHTLGIIVSIMVEHLRAQYSAGWIGEQGADVRLRIFSALFSIHCCPITNRLTYHGLGEDWPRVNAYITRSKTSESDSECTGFSWSPICSVVTLAAKQDTWWPVLRAILQQLRRVLEHIAFVETADDEQVEELAQALISIYQRAERGEISLHMYSEDTLSEKGQMDEKHLKGQIAKFLPPILCTLLNYPCRQELRNTELCKILVDCVAQESMEAVIACDLAIQLAPSAMAGMALVLTEALSRMHYNAVRAIPIMELLSDSAEIPEFHKFFQACVFKNSHVHGEILRAMSVFFQIGKIDSDWGDPKVPDRLTEMSQEHYYVNDSIITVKTLIEHVKERDRLDSLRENDGDDVFVSNIEHPRAVEPPQTPVGSFSEQRRRHQSAIQTRRPPNLSMDESSQRKTVDDMYATAGPLRRSSVSKVPIISWTQLIIRHMYGKSGWLMRSFEEWPADFEQSTAIPRSGSSLLLHFAHQPGAVRLGGKPNDEVLQRSKYFKIPGIEYHAVGVLYVGMYQETEAEILSNVYGSERYAKFLKLLGTPIPLDKHPGGLLPGKHGSYTYEYQDELSKITFLVATLMPQAENDPHCNMKKKLIANNFVSIVFNESGAPFKLGSVCGQFAHVALEVIPYDANNVLLQLHAKQEISCWLATRRALLNDRWVLKWGLRFFTGQF
ncbi:Rap/ran-GAP [Oesophagostomum dentatum]|uniref:Rap/ran-GAP n=1 Tax=Oesophagostomum dentatum TaxID=61180 RepID=A0A0B1T8M1_OESDE|nr:Rap/ran-GAP [Oesophagostomum dentatum]